MEWAIKWNVFKKPHVFRDNNFLSGRIIPSGGLDLSS